MKKKTTGHITIKDVAEFAGVSKSTVSRYINGKLDAISPEKVKNIKKAIAELNYRPSKMAQGLKIKKQINRICCSRHYKSLFSRSI